MLALMALIYYQYTRSFSYQYTAGRQADARKEYAEAMSHYKMALSKDETDARVLVALGNDCIRLKLNKQAEDYLLRAVKINGQYERAFRLLLQLYEKNGDYDSMEAALKYAGNDNVKRIFNDYLIRPPVFSVIGGRYDDDVILSLDLPEGGDDYEIFYTTDGKAPNGVNGHLYDGTIYLTEGKTKVRAVCRNANGKFGAVAQETYTIKYKAPEEPVVTPDGGEFTKETKVKITADPECSIYYVWAKKSETPDREDYKYTKEITIPKGYNVLSVVAIDRHDKKSKVYHMGFSYYPDEED